jgi:hypothetical protein
MGKILGAAAEGGPMGMAMGTAGGLITAAGSLIGGRKRRREERQARAEFDAQRQALIDYSFTNSFAGLENVAEDLTVNQQASQFQAQQTDAALAQSMQAAIASGGAAGGAQAIAQAALASKQGISADLARQEQANQMARVNQAAQLQKFEAQGEEDIQSQQYQQQQQLLNLASGRLNAAKQARSQATQQLFGGLGMAVEGGVAGFKGQ